jgi:hypothetical protein
VGTAYREKLIARINRKDWWHVPPLDPKAYKKRGMFLASTYREAEFYGRPLDEPFHVHVTNPLIGDQPTIETDLLGATYDHSSYKGRNWLKQIWKFDKLLKEAGIAKGYDAIVLLSAIGYARFLAEGRLPLSIELNLLGGLPRNALRPSAAVSCKWHLESLRDVSPQHPLVIALI